MQSTLEEFRSRFIFRQEFAGHLGVECEGFITDLQTGRIVPKIVDVLKTLGTSAGEYSSEFSACQVESRHGPCLLANLSSELDARNAYLQEKLAGMGLRVAYIPVAPDDMPLDVFPNPLFPIVDLSQDRLLATCRIAATHVHVGVSDHETALRAYNAACDQHDELTRLGDRSNGQHLELYKFLEKRKGWKPRKYASWGEFHAHAVRKKFDTKPRNNIQLIRISAHGTIEFRTFDTTEDIAEIESWACVCARICREAL